MEVTRENFEVVLSSLPEVIENAQFFTIDTEFTGLRVNGTSSVNYFDTLEDVYLKDRLKAETFMAIQVGLVAFFYDKDTEKYTHVAYHFYVYPSSHSDISFTCQSRCIKFLNSCGFDFNKLFKDGIPYLHQEEVDSLVRKLEEKYERDYSLENNTKMKVPEELTSTINNILDKISKILENDSKTNFEIERYNSFVRKLIYNSVFQEYGSTVFLETNKNNTITVSVGLSLEEIKKKQEENLLNEKKEIYSEVGFSKVIKMLIESKKMIIGHNLFLDLLFIIRQFLVPLPDTYAEFKELVTILFPKIIDTKYMAASEVKHIKDTSLNNLLEDLKKMKAVPEVGVNKRGMGCKMADKKFHEASFDAYLTGLCFLGMVKCLGNANHVSNIYKNLPDSPLLSSVLNKLFVPRLHDIFYMNLGGSDNEPDRKGVYHLTFPKEWTRENIYELFSSCGSIQIAWINSTSAFVKVKEEYIQEVERSLKKSNSIYTLISRKEFKSSNSDIAAPMLSPVIQKRPENKETTPSSRNWFIQPTSSESNKRKKFEEDCGEVVIERPQKKLCSSN